jgi:hypothetical protein
VKKVTFEEAMGRQERYKHQDVLSGVVSEGQDLSESPRAIAAAASSKNQLANPRTDSSRTSVFNRFGPLIWPPARKSRPFSLARRATAFPSAS